jgi:enterochelin esterase-like enzyme
VTADRAHVDASSPLIASLLQHGATPQAIDALFAAHRVPLTEGALNTFLWRGAADGVAVEHRVVGLPAPLALQRLADTDLWSAAVRLRPGARMEYRLLVRRGDSVENVLDPLNPEVATGPAGEMSVLRTEGYAVPDWAVPDPEAPPGRLTDVRLPSRALRRQAAVSVYLPARVQPGLHYPLLIVHDGADFLAHAAFGTALDNLMHRRLIADCVVVFTHPRNRMREYTAGPAHSRFLNRELVPELERTLPLRGDSCGRVLLGASLGAVASLAAAVRAPGMYGALMLESGTFRAGIAEHEEAPPLLTRVLRFVHTLQQRPPQQVTRRIFQTYGTYEPLASANRAMTATLRAMAGEVRVVEGLDGHNWTNWRDRLLDGLGWLLPPGAETNAEAGQAIG